MKTTLILPDALYRRIKVRAAASRRTVSSVVAELLETGWARERRPALPPLPEFDLGRECVDIADRDALWRTLDAAPGH